jgi:hypothetical protein
MKRIPQSLKWPLRPLKRLLTGSVGRFLARCCEAPSRRTELLAELAGDFQQTLWRNWRVEALRAGYLRKGLREEIAAGDGPVWEQRYVSRETLDAFRTFSDGKKHEQYGILNTDACVLWGLIRTFSPAVLIESGTCYGYSSIFLSEALQRYCNDPQFLTFSVNRDNCLAVARRNLAAYPFCTVIEGETQKLLLDRLKGLTKRPFGVFIDGPKGDSPAFLELMRLFRDQENLLFLACHDCEQSLPAGFSPQGRWPDGHLNRTRVAFEYSFRKHGYREHGFSLLFMTNTWCEEHEWLNKAIYESSPDYKPYFFSGSTQASHGTAVGVILRD